MFTRVSGRVCLALRKKIQGGIVVELTKARPQFSKQEYTDGHEFLKRSVS